MSKTFRQYAIDYIKNRHLCKGYVNYIVAQLNKLDKIEQIIDSRDGFYLYDNLPPFQQIKEVLEQE